MSEDKTAPRAAEANSEWHGGKAESIPEYFTKPRIVEDLAAAHPVLLVRQLANEILRLRSSRPAIVEECARVCDEQYATACATAIRALAPGEPQT
jgi:hypothetical protein